MSDKRETADAIIDEMRDCARAADPSIWGGAAIQKLVENTKRQQLAYCDRLDAALKRERAQVGNKAAWRAALMEIRSDAMSDYEQDADYLIDKCNAALTAPHRNCDKHSGWLTALKKFNDTVGKEKPWGDQVYDTRFLEWLFEQATEKGAEE